MLPLGDFGIDKDLYRTRILCNLQKSKSLGFILFLRIFFYFYLYHQSELSKILPEQKPRSLLDPDFSGNQTGKEDEKQGRLC